MSTHRTHCSQCPVTLEQLRETHTDHDAPFVSFLLLLIPRSLSGLQHVPGDSGGLHHAAPGRAAGLALRPAHSAAEEDGGRPAGLCPGQSAEGLGRHQVSSHASIFPSKKNLIINIDQLISFHVFPAALLLCLCRESFPHEQQFNILMRFIVDQTQTPNLKVKVAILRYIEALARQMDPADFVNSSETRLAVSRIITWTTEPKSSDVRKVGG